MDHQLDSIYDSLLSSYHSKDYDEFLKEAEEAREVIRKLKPVAPKELKPYPKITDPSFNERIYAKKEFNRYRVAQEYNNTLNGNYEDIVKSKCSTENFLLTSNQKLLKNFLSPLTPYNSLLLYHGVGVGKCHARDTPIIMYDGRVKMVQDVVAGDELMGDDGTPRTVLSLARGRDVMYKITPAYGGDAFVVNSEHILCLMDDDGKIYEMTVVDYLANKPNFMSLLYLYRARIDQFGYDAPHPIYHDPYNIGTSIPFEYLSHTRDVRMHVLAGILDRCSYDDIVSVPVQDMDNVCFLIRSLGFGAHKVDDTRIRVYGAGLDTIPTKKVVFSSDAKSAQKTNFEVLELFEDDYFGFVLDGNNRYLLGDFTVTHNTCTAISIAEQYLLEQNAKRILVVLSSNIKDNFKKQIFDITRYNIEMNVSTLCTGTKYPDMILDKGMLTPASLEKRIAKLIKERYQFIGYKELVELIKKFKQHVEKLEKNPAKHEQRLNDKIRDYFSDRLIIVDEAHNLRVPAENGKKQISNTLMQVLESSDNTKLLLLSATPMFNTSREIMYMLKLLHTNDRRGSSISLTGIIDKSGDLTDSGRKTLMRAARGYVSYMRGENPFSFPFRLYPSINKDVRVISKWPLKDAKGSPISKEERIKYLELVGSNMSDLQKRVYDDIKTKVDINEDEELDEPVDDASTNDLQNTIQICNITYPNKKADSVKGHYGKQGFESCFDRVDKKYFRYKDHVLKDHGEILSYPNIENYAPKIKSVLDNVMQAKGIVFVYSQYYYSGIFPLAIALEHIGFVRNGSSKPICQNMQSVTKGKSAGAGAKTPSYIIISRDKEFSPNNDKEIAEAKARANRNGEEIKVIIVSKVGSEGIDFKNIREVHILEPWFNLNRIEQIIGRGVRTCSHIDLPIEERNVTIFLHAATYSDKEESIDIKTYRVAEKKQNAINQVQKILKQSAFDCNLNKASLVYPVDKLNMKVPLMTSQGVSVKQYAVGDRDFSHICDYDKCQVTCIGDTPEEVEDTTFDPMFISDDIELYKRYIASIISTHQPAMSYDEIHSTLQTKFKSDIEEDVLAYALNEMVTLKSKFRLSNGHQGYLIYYGDLYIFQQIQHHETRLTLEERKDMKRRNQLDLNAMRVATPPKAPDNVSAPKEDKPASSEDILQNVQNDLKASQKLVKQLPKPCKITEKHVMDSIVDKLTLEEKVGILGSSDEALIDALNATGTVLRTSPGNKTYVYDVVSDNVYSVQAGTHKVVGPVEMTKISSQIDALKDALRLKQNTYVGMIEYSKKNEAQFKIRDNPKTKGFVCHQTSSLSVDDLTKRIVNEGQRLSEDKKYTKKQLCYIYELILRVKGASAFKRPHLKI
jgi:hypothetical protein